MFSNTAAPKMKKTLSGIPRLIFHRLMTTKSTVEASEFKIRVKISTDLNFQLPNML
jgi:hypothetical protein